MMKCLSSFLPSSLPSYSHDTAEYGRTERRSFGKNSGERAKERGALGEGGGGASSSVWAKLYVT